MSSIKIRLGSISFTTENIEEFLNKFTDQNQLLPLYLNHIRNGNVFTEEMLTNIENFDNSSKMKIIIEFNRVIKIFNYTIQD